MSIRAMNWAWEQEVRGGGLLVLLALADHADNDGICWPGQAHLAEKTKLSRQTVNEQLSHLEALELMHSEDVRDGTGRFLHKRYFLHLPRPAMSGKPTRSMSEKPTRDHVGISAPALSGSAAPTKEEPSNCNRKPPTSPPSGGGDLLALTAGEIERWFAAVFWPKYPWQKRRDKALTALLKLKPDEAQLSAIAAGLEHRLAAERALRGTKGAFIEHWPYPHRWLAEQRWTERTQLPPGARTPAEHDTRCAHRSAGARCESAGTRSHDGRAWYCATHFPEEPGGVPHGTNYTATVNS
jgi:hypothetical protein